MFWSEGATLARRAVKPSQRAEGYVHQDEAILRPDVGTQAQFSRQRQPKRYRYDDSLSPALEWDGLNPARELGEWLLAQIEEASSLPAPHLFAEPRSLGDVRIGGLADAVAELKRMSEPILNWAGKAEHLSFEVPTLPLFVHERLSTKAILETLKAHERDQQMEFRLFGDPQLSLAQQLEAYEHTGGWVNRLILGDSLIVMNSLLEYEGLGGQVQMIYIDPPYGVKFGSNFQPFVRRRDVRDGNDEDLTREPEMVTAYRDTWELGLHSYLTYLRDRFVVGRELLTESGSMFVQIGDENVHHVRELLDEVFGDENFVSQIVIRKTTSEGATHLGSTADYILWYGRDINKTKSRQLFTERSDESEARYDQVMEMDGSVRAATPEERADPSLLPTGARLFRVDNITSSRPAREGDLRVFEFNGKRFTPGSGTFKTNLAGMTRLAEANRLHVTSRGSLGYRRFADDFGYAAIGNLWNDISGAVQSRSDPKVYVVQSSTNVVARCMLLATNPGDLVLDPTCGAGTTAYVAENWGRRWITVDISRVPLALSRQRLLTATFQYYELQEPERGPASGFVYRRKQNRNGKEVGGVIPHLMLETIASNDAPAEEVLVDRPEVTSHITRVTGPFCVEATIPTPLDANEAESSVEDDSTFADRMRAVLRRNPLLQLTSNRSMKLLDIRVPSRSLTVSAEATFEGNLVALVFGPENGAISERLVFEGAREAHARSYSQVIFIGFAIEASARELIEKSGDLVDIPALYVQATPDLVMGDLLKTMRSSQIFSVTGLPDVAVSSVSPEHKGGPPRYQVELRGLDVFDPTTMLVDHRNGSDVPAWLLDTDYNELCFLVSQAFFPRTSAWENLKKTLNGEYDDSVWEHLAGTTSAPFAAGERRKIAVKVIDDRGNELLVAKSLDEVL